jgi:hypothetical protein
MRTLGAATAVMLVAATPSVAVAAPQNPCVTATVSLRCPDLAMKPPFGLAIDKRTTPGRVLLRAGNSVDNVGTGPAELRGVRTGPRYMRATQRIYKRAGGHISVRTGARLFFKHIPGQSYYWKFENAARFELWRLDAKGLRERRVRTGPKVSYCLRDLVHSRARLVGSPGASVYPACSTDPNATRRTLGTSVGWSDVYPSTYPEQWIDVTGLRGCFAYVHTADPLNHIYESNESNNEAQVIVRLPLGRSRPVCPVASRGATPGQTWWTEATEYTCGVACAISAALRA